MPFSEDALEKVIRMGSNALFRGRLEKGNQNREVKPFSEDALEKGNQKGEVKPFSEDDWKKVIRCK